jgi:long-subunit acyl-CoA synthetase (AMP-forming)
MFLQHDQVKQALGGNVRIVLSGAAPLSKHVEGFLRVVTCAHILQGYGMFFLNIWTIMNFCYIYVCDY